MKILKRQTKVGRFQEGGAMPAPAEAAPAEAAPQGGDPMEQIYQMAAEIVQQLGPDAAAMLAQAIMEMLQGGGAQPAPQGEPVYKKGGKLIGRMR
jgi:hypothetical protein